MGQNTCFLLGYITWILSQRICTEKKEKPIGELQQLQCALDHICICFALVQFLAKFRSFHLTLKSIPCLRPTLQRHCEGLLLMVLSITLKEQLFLKKHTKSKTRVQNYTPFETKIGNIDTCTLFLTETAIKPYPSGHAQTYIFHSTGRNPNQNNTRECL